MPVFIGFSLLTVVLTFVYIGVTICGASFYWRYLMLPILGFGVIVIGTFYGMVSGNFDPEPVSEYREYFFEEFARNVERSPDFGTSVELMRQNFENGVFSDFIDEIVPPKPSVYWLWLSLAALLLMIGAEFLRGKKIKRTLILVFSFAGIGFATYFFMADSLARYTKGHLMMSYQDEKVMLDQFAKSADATGLSQSEIAQIIRDYIKKYNFICHGEPYGELQKNLEFQE